MTSDEHDDSLVDPIQAALEQRGWRPVVGEGSRFVKHTLDNGHARLGVTYLASHKDVIFTYESDSHTVRFDVFFDGGPEPLLDVIFLHQENLSEGRWSAFVKDLLATSPKLVALAGEDFEDQTRIRTVHDGVAALQERDELDGMIAD